MRRSTRSFIPLLATILAVVAPAATLVATAAQPATATVWLAASRQQDQVLEHARTGSLDEPIPVEPSVTVGQFENGLRYFIRENGEPANRAELRLVVNVGSVLEDEDQLGLAHFLEHMAFNGTEDFEKHELIEFMESVGMRLGPHLNAGTSFDETRYMIRIPTDSSEVIATAFQILEDWAHGLTLDPEEIDKERGVVIEEWRLGQGAGARLRDKQFPIILRDSRYADRLPIGTKESLETFDHEALRRFYRDWYRPELMAVIAVGDFDASQIERLVRDHFEGIPSLTPSRERTVYGIPDHEETLFAIATDKEMSATSVSVLHKMALDEDETIGGFRQRILERLYNGMLNRRFSEIARQPDPPFLGAFSSKGRFVRSKGVYSLGAGVPEDGVARGLEVVFTEAERVARFGFTASELEREKIELLRGLERSYAERENRSSASYASQYRNAFLSGGSIPGISYEYELHKRFVPEITLEEVNQIGQQWVRPENRVVVVTGPEKEGLEMPSEEVLLAVLEGVAALEITPYEDSVTDQPLLANIPDGSEVVATREFAEGVLEWELGNGVKVALKPTDFREDQILFRGFSPGGTSLVSDEEYIPASTATALIEGGGLGAFNAIDLRKLLTGKAASAGPFISTFEEGVSGSASPKDLETLFQLIYLTFTAPRADSTFFQVWNTQIRRVLENRDARPAVALNDAITRIMTQGHVRSRPLTAELLDYTDLDKSLAFYQERFADASDFTFIFVGSIDLDTMRPLVERYLGGLPSTGRVETWRDLGVRPPKGVIEETVHKGIEPQSQTRLMFTGPFDYEVQSLRTGMNAMAGVLRTRLREVMREDMGGTYSVGVSASLSSRPEGAYRLSISFGSDPERADELVEVVFREIAGLQNSPPTEAEVHDAREALRRAFETNWESNAYWRNQISYAYRRGVKPVESLLTYEASIDAVTPADIQELARRYFDMGNRVRVTLLPEQSH